MIRWRHSNVRRDLVKSRDTSSMQCYIRAIRLTETGFLQFPHHNNGWYKNSEHKPREGNKFNQLRWRHNDAMASQISGVTILCSTVCCGADQRKHQSSASLASVRGIFPWPLDSPHKRPVTRKMFPFDDVIMPWEYARFREIPRPLC